MKDLLDQIDAAVRGRLYYVALFAALALPDICGALESEDGLANKARYVDWFNRYVAPRYTGSRGTTLTGEDAYYFRCSMLHQGRTQHASSGYSRILFVEPSSNVFHNNVLNDALNIDIRIFVADIINGVNAWLPTVQSSAFFQKNYDTFVRRYPDGIPPYIVGIPVIS